MGYEFRREPPCVGLAELLALMAEGKLRPEIALCAKMGEIAEVAARLMDRAFVGKAVLTF
jgi:D-arabinose 1-dehydrogenase-like Zn-dependent alcohol dehydrogenase